MATARKESAIGFFIWTALISGVLFVANQPIMAGVYHLAGGFWPQLLKSNGARQFAILVGPVLLLFFEWWLIDLLMRSRDQS